MIDAETKASIEAFRKKMEEKSRQVHTSLGKAILESCRNVENTAKLGMTNTKTDPMKAYPRQHGKKIHYASRDDEYPAVDTGTLRRSITHSVDIEDGETVGRVGTNLLYGKWLEESTSKMAARPWLSPSLNKNKDKIRQLIGNALKGTSIEQGTSE